MDKRIIAEKRVQLQSWMWRQRVGRAYSAHAGLIGDGEQLHFLFGVAGSGAGHLGRLISQPGIDIRYYNKPLSRFEPQPVLVRGGDPLAVGYDKTLERDHPLLRIYRMLVEYDNEWSSGRMSNRTPMEAPEKSPCLVHETHALLGTEAILREFNCRALLYVSDPVRIVDRLFEEQGFATPYMRTEGRSLFAPYFLGRMMRRDFKPVLDAYYTIRRLQDSRERIVLRRVLNVAVVQHMFRMLAARYPQQAILVEHDQLKNDPFMLPALLERLFGEAGLVIGDAAVTGATFRPEGRDGIIWKNSWPESLPWSGSLSAREIRSCYQVLEDSGLGNPAQEPEPKTLHLAKSA